MKHLAVLSATHLVLWSLDAGGRGGTIVKTIEMQNTTGPPTRLFFVPDLPFVGTLFEGSKHCHIWKVPQP